MGDMAKKKHSLSDKNAEREARKQETVHVENETIDNLAKKPGLKDKVISVRVNGNVYSNFKKICRARGIPANTCLNLLITDYIRENKKFLDD